jgi:poly(3-hydroxybutyrate) depolymerase
LTRSTVPGLDEAVSVWLRALDGMSRYWLDAVRRGAGPVELVDDVTRWWLATSDRRAPEWSTPHEVVLETRVARLRDFSIPGDGRVVPTLVVPPQAGHDSCIVDFSPEQSQIGVVLDAGLSRLAALDWIGADHGNRDAGIDDYLQTLDDAVEALGGEPVNLVGDCQGGWLATIYTALRPERVHTLTIAGAPIDFHAGEPGIHQWLRRLAPAGDLSFYRGLVASHGGTMPGAALLAGFIALAPEEELGKQLDLLANMHDEEHRERYRRFEDWYKHTQDVPGKFYLWIVERLFRDNALIRGDLEIQGRRLDLAKVSCPLNLVAGATDHITPPEQVFAAADHVSTPPEHIVRRLSPGGHLGLFMGREALREQWPVVLAAVRAVS